MEDKIIDMLSDLIKFDMQQIQNYREGIINISAMSVAASFAISAFIYGKDSCINIKTKKRIINFANASMLLFLGFLAFPHR